MKVLLMIIDGFGVGETPDADKFGDVGSNTLVNLNNKINLNLPNLQKLGLFNIDGVNLPHNQEVTGIYGKMAAKTFAKDTTSGHWELMGVYSKPFPVFTETGFPAKFVKIMEKATGLKLIGNRAASGTQIIEELGDAHMRDKTPILYTSADSVIQIACHVDVFPLEEQYKICQQIRNVAKGKFACARVIARPFHTNKEGKYQRLNDDRRDYSVAPPKNNLTLLEKKGINVCGVGKVKDIFAGKNMSESYHTTNNKDSSDKILQLLKEDKSRFIFANLIDTDMLYGHRNDCAGYAKELANIDSKIPEILKLMGEEDLLIVTSDHGLDPTTPSTDHSREYVPIMITSKKLSQNKNL